MPARRQSVYVLVEIADLGRVNAEGLSEKRADRFEFGQCFVGMPSGSERLGDDEARFKDLVRLVLVLGGVGILHVEPQVWQGLVRLAIST